MQVASLQLSRTLFEISGWTNVSQGWFYNQATNPKHFVLDKFDDVAFSESAKHECPAYDSGYLLRNLPEQYNRGYISVGAGGDNTWLGWYEGAKNDEGLMISADTPENVLCRLAIELFKQGVLK